MVIKEILCLHDRLAIGSAGTGVLSLFDSVFSGVSH